MAVPSLPSALNAGDFVSNAWVDAVRSNQAWFLDDRPVFKGQATGASSTTVGDSTATEFAFGQNGSFAFAPTINVGGWSLKTIEANPESLEVPESGIYLLTGSVTWTSNSTGYRQMAVRDGGSGISGLGAIQDARVGSWQSVSGVADLAAGDLLDFELYQSGGTGLVATVYLSAIWMQST